MTPADARTILRNAHMFPQSEIDKATAEHIAELRWRASIAPCPVEDAEWYNAPPPEAVSSRAKNITLALAGVVVVAVAAWWGW